MATKEKEAPTKEKGVEKTNPTDTSVATTTPTISLEEAAEKLKSAKTGDEDTGYLTFNPGDKVRVLFLGWREINAKGTVAEKVNAAIFATDKGKEMINADSAIRSYFERQQEGCRKEIHCVGTAKSDKGEYKTFKFYELND